MQATQPDELDLLIAKLRTTRQEKDMLEFDRMVDVYGPETLTQWLANATAIRLGLLNTRELSRI